MFDDIHLSNVRLFEQPEWKFSLEDLTVFCGMNSAGKSTILKALLVLRQSLGIQESLGRPRLRLIGKQVDVGNYESFVSHNDRSRDITLGLTFTSVTKKTLFRSLIPEDEKKSFEEFLNQSDADYVGYSLKSVFTFSLRRLNASESPDRAVGLPFEEGAVGSTEGSDQPILKSGIFELRAGPTNSVLLNWRILPKPSISNSWPEYVIELPKGYAEGGGQVQADPEEVGSKTFYYRTVLRGLLPDRILGSGKREKDPSMVSPVVGWPLPPHIEDAYYDLGRKLANISYLGPLRSPAQRFYTLAESLGAIDSSGEFLPYVLKEKANFEVVNFRDGESVQEPLVVAMNSWLHYFRTGVSQPQIGASELSIKTLQDVLLEIAVRTVSGKETHALSDSGFGYSQILPILASGLLTNPSYTLIVEEPEAHLNPSLQVRMAEFFVAMAASGKQILIETHSEHIVNMIRVAAAERQRLRPVSKIFFLDASETMRPSVHELSIRRDGSVPKWPKKFFGDAATLSGRLLRAQRKLAEKVGAQ